MKNFDPQKLVEELKKASEKIKKAAEETRVPVELRVSAKDYEKLKSVSNVAGGSLFSTPFVVKELPEGILEVVYMKVKE